MVQRRHVSATAAVQGDSASISSKAASPGPPGVAEDDDGPPVHRESLRSRIANEVLEDEAKGEHVLLSPALVRALSFEHQKRREKMRAHLAAVREEHARHPTDTGSAEVQVAALTERITNVSDHLRTNKGDKNALRGLQLMLARRKKHLKYLHRTDRERYYDLIASCGIKDQSFSQDKYKK